jgi:hypothetical protein
MCRKAMPSPLILIKGLPTPRVFPLLPTGGPDVALLLAPPMR